MKNQMELQLRSLFNSLKVQKSKQSVVQRASLITLFQYHSLDQQIPQFYRYICRSLQKLPDSNVKQQDFLKIILNPQVDLSNANQQQLADVFSILDSQKTGAIDLNKFLQMYKQSQNYLCLTQAQKKEVEDEIKQAFYSASEDGKLTPMDFYSIAKFRSA